MAEEKKEKRSYRKSDGIVLQIFASILCIAVGVLFLFVPGMQTMTICYIFCIGLIAAGIFQIARFFLTEAYISLHDYSFAMGVLFIVLGICGLLRINILSEHFALAMGFAALLLGTLILQGTVQMKIIGNYVWILLALFTVAVLAGAITVILGIESLLSLIANATWWILLVSGGASLISLGIVALCLFLFRRKRDREEEKDADEEPVPDMPSAPEALMPEHEVELPDDIDLPPVPGPTEAEVSASAIVPEESAADPEPVSAPVVENGPAPVEIRPDEQAAASYAAAEETAVSYAAPAAEEAADASSGFVPFPSEDVQGDVPETLMKVTEPDLFDADR